VNEIWRIAGGVRLRTLEGGRGAKLAIFWPGTGLPAEEFLDLAGRLQASGFRSILLDPPGHGQSAPWTGDWAFQHARDILAELIEAHGNPPALLVGHSLGATTILMAHDRLSNIRGLVLVDGGLPLPAPYKNYAAAARDLEDWMADNTYPDWEAWIRSARADLHHWDALVEAGVRAAMRQTRAGVVPAIDPPSVAAMLYCLSGYDAAQVAASSLPVLLLRGTEVAESDALNTLRLRLRALVVQTIAGAGHELVWDAPDAVADGVLAFAETVDWA
jgi:pimeloyl-ACP methyl ester carboxylesterase